MRRLLYVLMVLFLPLPAWANHDGQEDACHAAAVIGCENFEARAVGSELSGVLRGATYKNNGWYSAFNTEASPRVVDSSSGGVFSGNRAIQILCLEGANTCGFRAIMRQIAGCFPTCYVRWYEKWSSNYVYAPMGTKNVYHHLPSGHGNHMLQDTEGQISDYNIGGERPQPCNPPDVTKPGCVDSINYRQNTGPVPSGNPTAPGYFVGGQWYCLEHRATMNSSQFSFDGVLEAWMNGTQILSHTGVNLYNKSANMSTAGAYVEFEVEGYWNCQSGNPDSTPGLCANQAQVAPPNGDYHPQMMKWVDNVVVSSQRIGCLGAQPSQPPVDTLAPMAPKGLVVN